MKFQDRLQRDMTAEIEQDETPNCIAKELLDLGLIHEVRQSFLLYKSCFFSYNYDIFVLILSVRLRAG